MRVGPRSTGWLSHWGEVMANTTAQLVVNSMRAILEYANNTGSVSLYMAHGGTNFGYWAGAPLVFMHTGICHNRYASGHAAE